MRWIPKEDAALQRVLPTCRTLEEAAKRVSQIIERQVAPSSVRERCALLGIRGLLASELYRGPDEKSARAQEIPVKEPRSPADVFRNPPAWSMESNPIRTSEPKIDPVEEQIIELIEFTKRQPRTLEEVCDELDLAPKRARELIDQANEDGYRIEIVGGHIGIRPTASLLEEQTIAIDQAGPERCFAAVGDVHIGSKHFMRSQFLDFCDIAYSEGVRTFLQGGDLLDGVYRHSRWEQSEHGFEEQVQAAIETVPQLPGATWHFIQGNHDETFGEQSGLDVGRAIVQAFRGAGRSDLVYHGARGAYLRLKGPEDTRGLLVEMWHPRDRANAYALSYRAQKHIEKYAPGQKPDALLCFHWHQNFSFETRGVYAVSCGCWQNGQSSFGKSLGGAPSIGSWIINYALTEGGTVRRFKPEWLGYREVETVRDVELG